MAAAPLAVCAGRTNPQPPGVALPQSATDQRTPPGATSFATVALTFACVFAVRVAGGCCAKEIDGGTATMAVNATAGLAGVVAGEAAVMATAPPCGAVAGAV